jgi:hypothetical protein
VLVFADLFWSVWVVMLIVGDPILNFAYGEQYSLTHFLVTRIVTSFRVPILAWTAYHFLIAHTNK